MAQTSPIQVNGFGGIFLKVEDPKYLARWYEDNLGIGFGNNLYFSFKWRDAIQSESICRTDFCFFGMKSEYFSPSMRNIMLNIRVDDLDKALEYLKGKNVEVFEKTEAHQYGKFGWAMDPEGNKLELWQPIEAGFGDLGQKSALRGFVTGIGGVFIKSKDPKNLASWYKEHFNLPFQGPYCVIGWKDENNKEAEGSTVFSFFKEDTDYFNPSRSEFMINFRVNDLEKALSELRSNQVEVMEKSEDYDYGKFGWFVDPVGNKVELWQPK